jgi:hypothetical protein
MYFPEKQSRGNLSAPMKSAIELFLSAERNVPAFVFQNQGTDKPQF